MGGADEVCCNCVGGDCSGAGFGGGGNVMGDDVVDGGNSVTPVPSLMAGDRSLGVIARGHS